MYEALDFILITGLVINVLLLVLLSKKSKKVLFLFFSLTLSLILHFYAQSHDFDILFALTFVPAEVIEWMAGPLLFLYVRSVFQETRLSSATLSAHFIPTLFILTVLIIPLLVSLMSDKPILPYLESIENYSSAYVMVRNLYLALYLLLTYRLLQRSIFNVQSYYSSGKAKGVTWIRILLIGAFLVVVVDSITEFAEITGHISEWDSGYLSVSLMILLIIYVGYYGINQSSILLPDFIWQDDKPTATNEDYDLKEAKDIQRQLILVMESESLYLDEALTLGELAKKAGIPEKKISSVLNQHMDTNFYEFINSHRLKHFMKLVESDSLETQTMFSLAQESGFRSKATFNRFFKKKYDATPTQFLARKKAEIGITGSSDP